MAEQGLKAVIYPELDELGMREFVKQLNENLSGSMINVGLNAESLNVTGQSGGGGGGSVAGDVAKGTAVELSKDSVKTLAEGHKEGEKSVADDGEIPDKKNKGLLMSLGGIAGTIGTVATAVGVGAIGVAGATVGIYKFLESSSEPLRNVTGLFKQAFDLIWMPVGTILAVQLMPVLRDVMLKIADWMSRAWEIYDMEGWGGLIRGALATSFDVLCTLLTDAMPLFGNILGELFWEIFKRAPLGMLLQHFFGNDFWDSFQDVVNNIQDGVSKLMNVGTMVWDAFQQAPGYGLLVDIFNFIKGIWEKLTFQTVSETFDDVVSAGSSGIGKIASGDIIGGISDIANANPVVQFGKKLFGLADGGVVTEPTWRLFGEAGPEAVIPLNQLSNVVNDYNSNVNNAGGGNYITFNISGNNAVEIGEEVQRVLEKTVGKASSKLMWW